MDVKRCDRRLAVSKVSHQNSVLPNVSVARRRDRSVHPAVKMGHRAATSVAPIRPHIWLPIRPCAIAEQGRNKGLFPLSSRHSGSQAGLRTGSRTKGERPPALRWPPTRHLTAPGRPGSLPLRTSDVRRRALMSVHHQLVAGTGHRETDSQAALGSGLFAPAAAASALTEPSTQPDAGNYAMARQILSRTWPTTDGF